MKTTTTEPSTEPVRSIRLKYSHGKGFVVEVQEDIDQPFIPRTQFLPTVEEAVTQAAGAVGRELAFALTPAS